MKRKNEVCHHAEEEEENIRCQDQTTVLHFVCSQNPESITAFFKTQRVFFNKSHLTLKVAIHKTKMELRDFNYFSLPDWLFRSQANISSVSCPVCSPFISFDFGLGTW